MKKAELTQENLTLLEEKVGQILSGKRFSHTIAVAKEAVRLAEIYLPDQIHRIRAAALLHDITKEADDKKQLQYCEEFGIILSVPEKLSPKVLHAITGEMYAQRYFADFVDDDILSAIRWHTTGRRGMTTFEAIIYLADYIEETRTHETCRQLRKYFWDRIAAGCDPTETLRDAMIYSFDMTIEHLLKEGAMVNPDTIDARNDYLAARHV